jgi:integrase
LKFGYERSELLALDISSRADLMHALTYPPDNMPGWCIAGLMASVWKTISYGTHSMRRTKVTQIYRKTGNLRAVQLLLGHTKLESTVRHLGIEVDDALNIAEQIEL